MQLRILAAAIAAAAAGPAFAQTVTVSVQGPATAQPGEVVQLSVYAEAPDLPVAGAFAGYGLDLDVTAGASAVTGLSAATSPVLTLGTLPGTPGADSLTRAVGGQLSNLFSLNPSVDQSSPILLFTTDLTIDPSAPSNTDVTIEASASANGGVVIYPDVTLGGNVTAPDDPGTSLSFIPLTITVAPPAGCIGDLDGDGDTDVFDFGIFGPAFGTSLGDPGYLPEADFDNNDTIDVFDFGIFGPDFGCTP